MRAISAKAEEQISRSKVTLQRMLVCVEKGDALEAGTQNIQSRNALGCSRDMLRDEGGHRVVAIRFGRSQGNAAFGQPCAPLLACMQSID